MTSLCMFRLTLCTVLAGFCSIASAQATRTWVSGVGDDVNPCSRTAPCKTFQGTIPKTATGGEIDALDPGGFGALSITKAITLDGGGVLASILASGVNGITINAGPNDIVRIKNVVINGAGSTLGLNGIRFLAGKALILENVTIHDFSNNCIDLALNSSADLALRNVSMSNCGSSGVSVNTSAGSVTGILDQISVVKSGIGVFAARSAKLTIANSTLSQNSIGVNSDGGSTISLTDSVISNNGIGLQSNATANISRNTFAGNGIALSATNPAPSPFDAFGIRGNGGAIVSTGDNRLFGNGSDGSPTGNASLR